MADEEAIVRGEVMPGALRDVAGVRYEESTSLLQPVPVTSLAAMASGTRTAHPGRCRDDRRI